MQRRRRQASLSFAPLPRQLDLSKQLLQQPKREFEVGEDLQIRQQTTTVANEAELREVYERLFQPYETEVPREATTRTARALGNPTVTRPPRVTSGGSDAAHEVLRAAVNECVATGEWLELLVIARQARALSMHSQAGAIHCRSSFRDEQPRHFKKRSTLPF